MKIYKIKSEKIKIEPTGKKLHPAWRSRKIEAGEEGMELGGYEVYFDEEVANTMPEYDHLRPKFDE